MKSPQYASGRGSSFATILLAITVCSSIVAVLAGLSALSSCATTPEATATQMKWAVGATNVLVQLSEVAKVLPEPIGSGLTLLITASLAGLAGWISHLHRSMTLLNGKERTREETARAPPAPAAPAPTTTPG